MTDLQGIQYNAIIQYVYNMNTRTRLAHETGLTLKALSKIIADDIILVFLLLFFRVIKSWHFTKQTIHIKCQVLFSLKKKMSPATAVIST